MRMARNVSTVLIIFMNNPNSITSNSHSKDKHASFLANADPRFQALLSTAWAMTRRGHHVLVEVAGGLSIRPAIAKRLLAGFEWIDADALQRYGRPDLVVCWFAYFADKGTRQNMLVRRLLEDPAIPRLWYENGMTKGSVTVDPKGFLADSFYMPSLNRLVQEHFDATVCRMHIQQHLKHDSSKRPQARVVDVPRAILGDYIFIPTQKWNDLSVVRYSRVSYPRLLEGATSFCRGNNLSLVVKIHPHLRGEARAEQQRAIRQLRARYPAVYESHASINFLTAHARFTVTLNGGTLMDNFYTESPVLALARGFFSSTDAVISDDDVQRGLTRMVTHELPWAEARKERQRQVVCWYDRMSLKAAGTGAQNIRVIQSHMDALQLPRRITL